MSKIGEMTRWIINQQDNCVKANFSKLVKLVVGIIKLSNAKKVSLKNLLDKPSLLKVEKTST